tara:strand:- start:414 stop:758 length:345 start_codon:yes stop_codon:yes gene_type:complete
MNQHKYAFIEKPCLECGKMHKRKKFCSPYCGSKYNANYRRNVMGVDDPRFSSANINAIIKGKESPIADNGYNFVFSNDIEDWIGSKLRRKREKYADKRKAKLIKENGTKDTKTD